MFRASTIKNAIVYPFKRQNFANTIVIPSGLSLVSSILMGIAIFMAAIPLIAPGIAQSSVMGSFAPEIEAVAGLISASVALPLAAICFCLALAMVIPVYGFTWQMVRHWQIYGLETPAPSWQKSWPTFYRSGIQIVVASVVFAIPMCLAAIPLGAAMPFLIAPYFLAAKEQSFVAILKNIQPGIQLIQERMGKIYLGFYLSVILGIGYSIVASLFSWALIVAPILMAAAGISCLYLLCDTFDVKSSGMSHQDQGLARQPEKEGQSMGFLDQLLPSKGDKKAEALVNIADVEGEAVMVYDNLSQEQDVKSAQPAMIGNYDADRNPWLKHRS